METSSMATACATAPLFSDVSLDISLKGYVPLQDLLHVYHKDNINAVSVQLQKQKSGH